FFFSSRRRHTRFDCDWSSDVCSSDLNSHRLSRGGVRPTITDANLLLGRLNPNKLLAVDVPVSLDRIADAFVAHVGTKLDLDATRSEERRVGKECRSRG